MDKPKNGSPCNHCGLCCRKELCVLAKSVWGDYHPAPCPALRMSEDGVSACGLVEEPAAYLPLPIRKPIARKLGEAARQVIGAGLGCDTLGDGERPNIAFDHALNSNFRRNRARLVKAAAAWGLSSIRRGGPPDA